MAASSIVIFALVPDSLLFAGKINHGKCGFKGFINQSTNTLFQSSFFATFPRVFRGHRSLSTNSARNGAKRESWKRNLSLCLSLHLSLFDPTRGTRNTW